VSCAPNARGSGAPAARPEVAPPAEVEDEVAARRYDGLRDAADLVARAAKTDREREILMLRAFDDAVTTDVEAAHMLGIAASTVRNHRRQMRARLRMRR
jgi:DNA-binding CsgD family transcriptional regulator